MRHQNVPNPAIFSLSRFLDPFSTIKGNGSHAEFGSASSPTAEPHHVRNFRDEDITFEDKIVRPLIPDRKNRLVLKGEYIDEDPLLMGLPSYRMPCLDLRSIEKGIGSVFSLIIRKIQITGKQIRIPKDLLPVQKSMRPTGKATVIEYIMRDPLPVKAKIVKTYFRDDQDLIREECAVFHRGTCLTILMQMFFRDGISPSTFFSLPKFTPSEENNHLIVCRDRYPSDVDSKVRDEIIRQARTDTVSRLAFSSGA
ncbi:MAG: hypothetical protein WCJ25_02785 [Candidatus Moraniibacteriota bacterium]